MRLAASIRDKSLKPSETLRKLGAYRQQNRLYLALGEIGRTERTLFTLDWIENVALSMECRAGLDKGEARHSLVCAVFAHSQRRIHDRSDAAQQKRAMALNLVIAAITFWNTVYMDKAAPATSRRPARSMMPSCLPTHRPSDGTTSSYPATSIGIQAPLTAKLRTP